MSLLDSLIEIAEKDNLPDNHFIRSAVSGLDNALCKNKKDKDFADTLLTAEAEAFAAYKKYTGKIFEDESEEE